MTVRMKVCGGLGNQLFQYAAGLALARRHQARLIIDASFYRTKSHRSFQLNQLELDYDLQGDDKSVQGLSSTPTGELVGSDAKCPAEPRQDTESWFSERSFCFDERFLALTPPVVLQGYYQSVRYFHDIDDELRMQIRLRGQPCVRFYEALNAIESSKTPVAVHVRRGDLITADGVHPVHGCLSWPYYSKALHIISRLIDNDHDLFIFGDDLAALGEMQAKIARSIIVSHSDLSAAEDLILMKKCRHFITANR